MARKSEKTIDTDLNLKKLAFDQFERDMNRSLDTNHNKKEIIFFKTHQMNNLTKMNKNFHRRYVADSIQSNLFKSKQEHSSCIFEGKVRSLGSGMKMKDIALHLSPPDSNHE